jgi:hypothetical protein
MPLIAETDSMMAILNSGDGATIEFPAGSLPAPNSASARTLLLYTRGWIKEADPNTLPDRGVDPLPESAVGSSSSTAPSAGWQFEYNTRWEPSSFDHRGDIQ